MLRGVKRSATWQDTHMKAKTIEQEIQEHAKEHSRIIKKHSSLERGLLVLAWFIREFKK